MLKAKYEKVPAGKTQGHATKMVTVGKNYSKHIRGWRVSWPFKETKSLKVAVDTLKPVGTHSSNHEAQGLKTEPPSTNTHLINGPQATSAKQGSAYWFQLPTVVPPSA